MTTDLRRAARSRREAGQGRVDMVYRMLTLPPKAFATARVARTAAGARIEARAAFRIDLWESEGGALASLAFALAVRHRTDAAAVRI